ncbi:hypothetical protein TWF679_010458 [Orbilia oligospora]|uniref:SMB domain-containing protein n=1 Tax=Orbilia oligospora TaxID=2813651 RepID=A0A8H8V0J4_ORBOL|nr:hypothetical protein TWF679_010458 [Orbilia oligospora]
MWSERTHFATTASMLLALTTRLTNTQLVIPETAESTKIATQALVFYFSDGTTYGYTDYAYGWNGNCNKLYSPAPGKATVDYVEYLPESSAVPGVFSKNVDDPDIGRTEDLELRKVIIYRDPHCTEEVVEKVQKEENEDGKEVSESIEVLEPIELDVQDKIQENEKASEGEQDDVHHDSTHVFLNDQGLNLDAPASFKLILGRKMKLPTLIDQIPIEGASEEGSSINENLVNNETQGQPNSPEIASEETSNAPTEETLTEEEGEIITGSTSSDGILIEAQATEESNTSINTPDQDRDSKDTSSDGSSSNNHSDENNSMSGINEESHNDDEGQISGGGGPEQPASEDQQPRGNEDTGKSSTREKEDEASAEKKSHEEIEKINSTDEYFTELEIEDDDDEEEEEEERGEGETEGEEKKAEDEDEEKEQRNSSKRPVYNIFKNIETVVEEQHDEEFKEEIHEKPQSEEAQNNEREQIEKHKETENSASTPSQTEQPEGVENNQTKESASQEPLQEIPTENQESPPSTEEQQSKSPFEESGHEETDHETTADSPHPEVTPPPKEEPSVAVVTVTVHVGEESTPEPTSVEESPTTTTENTVSPTVEETAVETTPNVPGLTFTPDSEYCDPKQPDSSCYVECDVEDPYCCHPTDKDFPDCCDPDDEECWRHQFILDKPDEVTPATTESQPNQTTEPPPQAQETPAKEPEGTPDESTPEPEKQEVAPQPAKRDQIPTGPSAEDFGREDSNSSLTFKQLAKSRLLRFLR